jgi:hypothetical protein
MTIENDFMYNNFDLYVKNHHDFTDLNIDFQIGTIFEYPLNKIFKKQRKLETVRFDFPRMKGCTVEPPKRPDFKIVYCQRESPYYSLFRMYGDGALEIKVHLTTDINSSANNDRTDRYQLLRKMQESGFKWGVLLSLFKSGKIREWSCVKL